MNRGSSISCHDEIISNEDLAEEAGKDVEQIQHAADSCVNLRPIVDPVVCHLMPLAVYGVRIDKASTVAMIVVKKSRRRDNREIFGLVCQISGKH
jgi:hypothetical protein